MHIQQLIATQIMENSIALGFIKCCYAKHFAFLTSIVGYGWQSYKLVLTVTVPHMYINSQTFVYVASYVYPFQILSVAPIAIGFISWTNLLKYTETMPVYKSYIIKWIVLKIIALKTIISVLQLYCYVHTYYNLCLQVVHVYIAMYIRNYIMFLDKVAVGFAQFC